MMKKYLIIFANILFIRAEWGQGACPENDDYMSELDFGKFEGYWLETYRDKLHDQLSDEKCTSTQYRKQAFGVRYIITRYSTSKFFGSSISEKGMVYFERADGNGWENFGWRQGTHQIVVTDYDNYALVYGCQQFLFGLLGHFKWYTLLSREYSLGANYTQLAKNRLTYFNYDWGSNWVKPSLECKITTDPTSEEEMIAIFQYEPNWLNYNKFDETTVFARYLFEDNNPYTPSGFVTKSFQYNDKTKIATNLTSIIQQSFYQSFYQITDLKYDSSSSIKYDVYFLSVGLDEAAQTKFADMETNNATCCFQDIENLITGFARIIVKNQFSENIIKFQEGQFLNGAQTGFGRLMDTTYPGMKMISYTGWWPTSESAKGMGVIVKTDGTYEKYEGIFPVNSQFPYVGLDQLSQSAIIDSLTTSN